jgi:predicted outer membrane protein
MLLVIHRSSSALLAAALCLAPAPGFAAAASREPAAVASGGNLPGLGISGPDVEFMLRTARADMLQIDAARLVLASTPSVALARLARAELSEHSRSLSRLRGLARSMDVALPRRSAGAEAGVIAALRGLRRLGPEHHRDFELEYLTRVAIGKQRAEVRDFHTAALGRGRDGRLRRFAISQLPILQRHVVQSRSIAARLRSSEESAREAAALGGEAAVSDAEGETTLRPPVRRRPRP